jgi:hypothetical protein
MWDSCRSSSVGLNGSLCCSGFAKPPPIASLQAQDDLLWPCQCQNKWASCAEGQQRRMCEYYNGPTQASESTFLEQLTGFCFFGQLPSLFDPALYLAQ